MGVLPLTLSLAVLGLPCEESPVSNPKANPKTIPRTDTATEAGEPPRASASIVSDGPWTVGAFVDVAYLINTNAPANHVYRGTVTTPRTGEFTVNLMSAYLFHEPTDDAPWRFEIAGQFGASTDALYAGEPNGSGAGAEVWKHLGRANAGVRIRRTQTEIGAGLFASPIGIGGFWSRFNWNVSPSWASNAAPFYLAGVRIQQALPAGFGLEAWVVNGWQTVADVNAAPSYLAGLSWSGSEVNVGQYVYFGPDQPDLSPAAWRVHSDTFVVWERPRFGFGAAWDYGQERVESVPGEHRVHRWTGGGLFVHGVAVEREHLELDLAVRPDLWFERGGSIHGASQWLISGTVTASLRLYDAVLARLEYRYDHSTANDGYFFRGDAISAGAAGLANDQHTVFLNLVGYFETSFGLRFRRGRP